MTVKARKRKKKKKGKKKHPSCFHRAHPLEIHASQSKIDEAVKVYHQYRIVSAKIAKYQWKLLFQGSIQFSNNRDWLPTSPLIARYCRDAEYQTVETLKGFISNRVNDFRYYVETSSLDDETKHQLHTINCWKAWYYRPTKEIKEVIDPRITSHNKLVTKRNTAKIEKLLAEKSGTIAKQKKLKHQLILELLTLTKEIKESIDPRITNYKGLVTKRTIEKLLAPNPPYFLFPQKIFRLARRIMKDILKKNQRPTFNKCNMKLSANVAEVMPRKEHSLPKGHIKGPPKNRTKCYKCKDCHSAKEFAYWVRFSTLNVGKPIYLPLQDYPYFEEQKEGKLCRKLQFNFSDHKEMQIAAIVEKTKFEDLSQEEQDARLIKHLGSSVPLSGEISFDSGLVIPLATDKGSLHGLSFYKQLQKYDRRILKLTKLLNKYGIPWNESKRYRGFQQDIRGFIDNEFNRIINRIVKIYRPARIIVDDLDFSNSKLSRRMNRLLRNCGVGVIRKKLESLSEELGIEVIWINPAYTSRECGHCGYIDRNNRRGRKFNCRLCGYTIHSDVSGARRGKDRSSVQYPFPITLETTVAGVRRSLVHRFVDQFRTLQKEPGHWLSRLRSKAMMLLQKNPYYKDILDTPLFKEAFGIGIGWRGKSKEVSRSFHKLQ